MQVELLWWIEIDSMCITTCSMHFSEIMVPVFCLQVKNLRSSVARGAIACLGDMFATMQRAMEQVRLYVHSFSSSLDSINFSNTL